MFLNFNGIQFPIDDELLTPSEADGVRLAPGGGMMRPEWIEMWEYAFNAGDTVVDVGANVGIVSIILALMGGMVRAIEGAPHHASRLYNICSPLRQIKVHGIALGDENKWVNSHFNDCTGIEQGTQKIQYVRYDDFARVSGFPDPRFIKIDIEGMESVALLGMQRLIQDVRPTWQIEYHPDIKFEHDDYPGFVPVEKGGFDFREFTKAGYSILNERLDPVKELTTSGNYFFLP